MKIQQEKREPTYPTMEYDDHYDLIVPSYYLPRQERRRLRNEYGELVDKVFSDYSEMYIRIWKTISKFMDEHHCETLEITTSPCMASPYEKDMLANICYCQFDVVDDLSRTKVTVCKGKIQRIDEINILISSPELKMNNTIERT